MIRKITANVLKLICIAIICIFVVNTSYAACSCSLNLTATDKEINIETAEGITLNLPNDVASATFNKAADCDEHKDQAVNIEYNYEILSQNDCTATILDNNLNVEVADGKGSCEFRLKVIANAGGKTEEKEITIRLVKSAAGAPEITEAYYDASTSEVVVTIDPKGNKNTTIKIGGITDKNVQFEKKWFKYQKKTFKIRVDDTTVPNPVTGVSIERELPLPANKQEAKALLSWIDRGDQDDIRQVYCVSESKTSNSLDVNIKSDTLLKRITFYKVDDSGTKIAYTIPSFNNSTEGNSVKIPLNINLRWNTVIVVEASDKAGNNSQTAILETTQVNKVIYDYEIVDDYTSANEGETLDIDVIINDTHDPLYSRPLLKSTDFETGLGKAVILNPGSNNTSMPNEYISFVTDDGGGATQVRIKYTYEKVREDIPPASGYIIITVGARNQEPVAVDDPVTVTGKWGLTMQDMGNNYEIRIPVTKILANDTDREDKPTASSPVNGIRIASISHEILGDVILDNPNGTADQQTIILKPSKSVSGQVSFRYKIVDSGGLQCLNTATVNIEIERPKKAPEAEEVVTFVEVEADPNGKLFTKKITQNIQLKVKDDSNAGFSLYNPSGYAIHVNGSPATSAHKISLSEGRTTDDVGRSTPYIKLEIGQGSTLKEHDVISFNYTIAFEGATSQNLVKATITTDGEPNEGYLYVHRRPLAMFTPKAQVIGNRVVSCIIQDEGEVKHEASYDLDHQVTHSEDSSIRPSYSLSGIRAWEWGVRYLDGSWTTKVFDAYGKSGDVASPGGTVNYNGAIQARAAGLSWVQAQLNSMIGSSGSTRTIEISLRVRDVDATISDADLKAGTGGIGVWSEPKMMIITSLEMKPVANFRTDKSYYLVPKTYTKGVPDKALIKLTDMSYDPNGDEILEWHWELKNNDGETTLLTIDKTRGIPDIRNVQTQISDKIYDIVQSPSYNPTSPNYTITLKVVEDTSARLESDVYSYTFVVYKDNEPPKIDTTPGTGTGPEAGLGINGTLLYEDDKGKDGYIGDNYGKTVGDSNHVKGKNVTTADQQKGTPKWKTMFTVKDDGPLNRLESSWLFEGQSVPTRKDWSDTNKVVTTKSYTGVSPAYDASTGVKPPFNGTVSSVGMLPGGAYKISIAIKDNPSSGNPNIYPPDSSKTVYLSTAGEPPEAPPYHLFIVPSLEMYTTVECNGWMLVLMDDNSMSSSEDAARYDWIRVEDGKTREELGIPLEDIVPTIGDTLTIKTVTNKYVSDLYCYNDLNKNEKYDAGDELIKMEKVDQNLDTTINWIGSYLIEDADSDEPNSETAAKFDLTTLLFRMHGSTMWGSETQDKVTREKDNPVPVIILPVKLYDFRITEVTDPNISSEVNAYIGKLQQAGDKLEMGKGNRTTDGVLVGHLALESKDYTDSNYLDMRKGYSFYFKVSSKGMKKDGDLVRITPKFYAVNEDSSGNLSITNELIGYVPGKNGKYTPYTTEEAYKDDYINELYSLYYEGAKEHSLNNHSSILIRTDLREENGKTEQIWYGRYGVPADAKFFKVGTTSNEITSMNEWKGKVLIAFQFEAIKDGKCRYNYVEKGQWEKERNFIVDNEKILWKNKETEWFNSKHWYGTIITIDTSKNINDDYISNPVWRD